MGKLYNQHLRILGRSEREWESFHRRDGTLKYQAGRKLSTHKGRRSIVFMEAWYDEHEVRTACRESEYRQGVDYEYIRRVYRCDAFGNTIHCREVTITLENPRRAEIEARQPAMSADQSLRALLRMYQIELPDADDPAPQISPSSPPPPPPPAPNTLRLTGPVTPSTLSVSSAALFLPAPKKK